MAGRYEAAMDEPQRRYLTGIGRDDDPRGADQYRAPSLRQLLRSGVRRIPPLRIEAESSPLQRLRAEEQRRAEAAASGASQNIAENDKQRRPNAGPCYEAPAPSTRAT